MAGPSLGYGGTTVVLPRVGRNGAQRLPLGGVARTSAGGYEHLQLPWRKWEYRLEYPLISLALYESIVDLWEAAADTGTFPTFTYSDRWPDCVAIPVRVELAGDEWTTPGITEASCSLRLVEANPR